MQYIFMMLVAFIGGAMIAFQAPLNSKLGMTLGGGPLIAAFISFLVGTIALGTILIVKQQIPSADDIARTVPWMWIGGLMGAIYVWGSISAVPVLGSALMISIVVAGQLVSALYIDKTGFLLPAALDISWQRIVGAALVMGGVILFARY
jgi:transporter family-2 protein